MKEAELVRSLLRLEMLVCRAVLQLARDLILILLVLILELNSLVMMMMMTSRVKNVLLILLALTVQMARLNITKTAKASNARPGPCLTMSSSAFCESCEK